MVQITLLIHEDCYVAVAVFVGFDFQLGIESRGSRLHMIHFYTLSWGGRLLDGSPVDCRLVALWELFRGTI